MGFPDTPSRCYIFFSSLKRRYKHDSEHQRRLCYATNFSGFLTIISHTSVTLWSLGIRDTCSTFTAFLLTRQRIQQRGANSCCISSDRHTDGRTKCYPTMKTTIDGNVGSAANEYSLSKTSNCTPKIVSMNR